MKIYIVTRPQSKTRSVEECILKVCAERAAAQDYITHGMSLQGKADRTALLDHRMRPDAWTTVISLVGGENRDRHVDHTHRQPTSGGGH